MIKTYLEYRLDQNTNVSLRKSIFLKFCLISSINVSHWNIISRLFGFLHEFQRKLLSNFLPVVVDSVELFITVRPKEGNGLLKL